MLFAISESQGATHDGDLGSKLTINALARMAYHLHEALFQFRFRSGQSGFYAVFLLDWSESIKIVSERLCYCMSAHDVLLVQANYIARDPWQLDIEIDD